MAQVVFVGIRVHGGHKSYCYYNPEDTHILSFDKLLVKDTGSVGAVIECTISEDGKTYSKSKLLRGTLKSDPWYELMTEWYLYDRNAKGNLQDILDLKKYSGDPVDKLIKEVRNSMMFSCSKLEKARIARYVFEQLLK